MSERRITVNYKGNIYYKRLDERYQNEKYKVGSLFAGIGGICLGFQNACTEQSGYELAWANEIDEFACTTYRTNFEHTLLEGDIKLVLHPELIDEEILQKINSYENS